MLYWQGATLLNPHLATGSKDIDGCRLCHEPLATWDADANLHPVLAAEIPSRDNGGQSADGRTVPWKPKRGVNWHGAAPFTAGAVSAARAVLQTGECGLAWNLLFEDEVLKRMEARSLGRVTIQAVLWGRGGAATVNIVNSPARFRSPNTRIEFPVDKANAVLDAAGWKRAGGSGGVVSMREKDGGKRRLLFQTSVNDIRQKTQAILKQSCQKAGIELELKTFTAAVVFLSDTGNPDTAAKSGADMQKYGINGGVDPERAMDACLR